MLKWLGIFCILLGSAGFGFSLAKELDLRILELCQLEQLMLCLRGEIRYMHQPLPEAFFNISKSAKKPFSDFFVQMAKDLQGRNGQTADEIWKKNLAIYFSQLHISRQEWQGLERLGSMLGYLDVEMQLGVLDYYLEQLKQSLLQAHEASKSRKRLYQYMGILGGAALAILII